MRQALYAFLKINETITEVFPIYEKGKFVWNETKVQGDNKYISFLSEPDVAIDFFFPEINDLHKHLHEEDLKYYVYSIVSVTLEICSVAMERSFYELIAKSLPKFLKGYHLEDFCKKIEKKKKEAIFRNVEENKKFEDFEEFKDQKNKLEKGKNLICKNCHKNFFISDTDFATFTSKNLNLPKRCRDCRRIRRNIKNYSPKKDKLKRGVKEKIKEIYYEGEKTKELFKATNKQEKQNLFFD